MEIHVKKDNSLYQGCENKHLIRRLVYLIEDVTKNGGTKSECDEIEHIKNLLEQQDMITYLQKREKELRELMNDWTMGSAMYNETRAKHIELFNIMKDLKIESISNN